MNKPVDPAILSREVVRIGVVADTHVPDRVANLHPDLLPGLQSACVDMIVHLGDICEQGVLDQLARVAPLSAVKGNRDWLFGDRFPLVYELNIHGKRCLFMHGHGGVRRYFMDKWRHAVEGYRLERYLAVFQTFLRQADLIAFGHTHFPEHHWQNGCLLFNPGSASATWTGQESPGFGVIQIRRGGEISADRVILSGFILRSRAWHPAAKPW